MEAAHATAIVGYIDGQPNRCRTLRVENIKAKMAPTAAGALAATASRYGRARRDGRRAIPAPLFAGGNAAFSCA
jgi:hypothetical protein